MNKAHDEHREESVSMRKVPVLEFLNSWGDREREFVLRWIDRALHAAGSQSEDVTRVLENLQEHMVHRQLEDVVEKKKVFHSHVERLWNEEDETGMDFRYRELRRAS